jgi:hypothetical protein
MKLKIRRRKKNDSKRVQEGLDLMLLLMKTHPEIETTLWYSAFLSAFAIGLRKTGVSYEQFCDQMDSVKSHYKFWWDE